MRNLTILTPAFNDRKSLNKLLKQIDKNVYKIKGNFSVFVINDASTIKPNLSLQRLKTSKKIKIHIY
jgi:glycosyltransferase involved in cell wall biosynthesis|tara:strand:- start:1456 stop:1656 length:201 start_codon:yes stop_codon:yes gene_type:complete